MFSIRYSARQFARAPSLSLALLLTIALGIGSNVSVRRFALGLTRPDSPLGSDSRVVSIFAGETGALSYQDYLSLRSHADWFEWIGAARVVPGAMGSVAAVTPDLAGALKLSLGKGVVISQRLGKSENIRIDGVEVRVDGVAPETLEGVYHDRPIDVWMPFDEAADHSGRNFWVLGRLRKDVSMRQAQAALEPDHMRVVPYTGMTPEMAEGLARVGTLIGWAGGLVFFIACANVASFLLGRATARSKETSVRIALGAGRGQLMRGLLSDSFVISVAGGAFGTLLAVWTSHILPALLFEQDAERLIARTDILGIVAASAACIGLTMVCGLVPVFAISHDRPAIVLRRESAGPSTAIRRLRVGLVVAQMTSCCVLVIATTFLFEGLHTALQTSLGRRLGHPILATVQTADLFGGTRYFEGVQSAVQSVGGVSAMAWMKQLPGGLPAWRSFRVEPQQPAVREVRMDIAEVSGESLPLFVLPPEAGRFFGGADQTCRAAVANKEAAEALFGADTAGRSIREPTGAAVDIIGVVRMRHASGRSNPTLYYWTDKPAERIAAARFRAPAVSKMERAQLGVNVVSPNYFEAMGFPLVAGRIFPDSPMAGGCRVGVINQEAADLYFGGQAVGASVIDDIGLRTEIIGVVHAAPLGTFEPRVGPAIYFPMAQDCAQSMTVMLRARDGNDSTLGTLHSRIEEVPGRGRGSIQVRTLDTYLGQTALAPLRIATLIIGASATTAFLLSVLGLFGALSDAARQRRREMAVRLALGARRRHVILQVLREGGRLAGAGIVAGTLGSLLLSRTLAKIAPGSGSPPFWVWLAAPLVLAGAVAIASVLPARRSLIVNPLTIMGDH